MQSNTDKAHLLDFSDDEKLEIEGQLLNDRIIQVIKALMVQKGIKTRKELAHLTGTSPAYISKVFRSEKNINIAFLVKIQRVFATTFTFNARSLEADKSDLALSRRHKGSKITNIPASPYIATTGQVSVFRETVKK